jgi:hypothetical protein
MSVVRGGLVFALLCGSIAAASAQMELADWYDVPSETAGLVLVLDPEFLVDSVAVIDPDDGIIDDAKWGLEAPFVKQYRLEPGSYTIRFPEGARRPAHSIGVSLSAGALSFVEIAVYQPEGGSDGVQIISWTGQPRPEIEALLVGLWRDYTEVMQPTFISPEQNVIELQTIPPWRTNGTDDPGPSIQPK